MGDGVQLQQADHHHHRQQQKQRCIPEEEEEGYDGERGHCSLAPRGKRRNHWVQRPSVSVGGGAGGRFQAVKGQHEARPRSGGFGNGVGKSNPSSR